jgi:hypothetical protein
MRNLGKFVGVLVLGAMAACCATAQEVAGSVHGTVTDGSGAIVANAK